MNRTKNLNECITYRRFKSLAQRQIRVAARQHWQNYCNQLTSSTRLSAVWNMTKRMNGTKSNTSSALIDNGHIVDQNEDKAERFGRAFAKASSTENYTQEFRQHREDIEQNHPDLFANNAPITEKSQQLNTYFNRWELRLAILHTKKNSTPGEDRLVYEFFQQMPSAFYDVILRYFNLIWRQGRLPAAWKHAIVIPILKADPSSYSTTVYVVEQWKAHQHQHWK